MRNKILAGLTALLSMVAVEKGLAQETRIVRPMVPIPAEERDQTSDDYPNYKVDNGRKVYTLVPGNYKLFKEQDGENGRVCVSIGNVKINDTFILVEEDNKKPIMPLQDYLNQQKKNSKPMVRNVEVFDKDGKFLYFRQKEVKAQFHSTTPVIINPDGSIDAYRPLNPNENLEDVMKKGPVERFTPNPIYLPIQ